MTKTTTGVVAALTHDVLTRERFACAGDLAEAIKVRCAKLRIPYDSGTVSAALDLVARTRRLVVEPPRPVERIAHVPVLGREEAAQVLARLNAVVRTMR